MNDTKFLEIPMLWYEISLVYYAGVSDFFASVNIRIKFARFTSFQ